MAPAKRIITLLRDAFVLPAGCCSIALEAGFHVLPFDYLIGLELASVNPLGV
jgi:cell division FtsZ-interacting protein ZapD